MYKIVQNEKQPMPLKNISKHLDNTTKNIT